MQSTLPSQNPAQRRARSVFEIAALAVLLMMPSCAVLLRPTGYDAFATALKQGQAIQIYDTLEALVANGDDTKAYRKDAYRTIRDRNEDTRVPVRMGGDHGPLRAVQGPAGSEPAQEH